MCEELHIWSEQLHVWCEKLHIFCEESTYCVNSFLSCFLFVCFFEEKGEPKRYRTEVLPLTTSLTTFHRWAKPAHQSEACPASILKAATSWPVLCGQCQAVKQQLAS